MFYKGKNVLVAGGAGMTGQSLIRKLLDEGAHVRATQYRARKITLTHKQLEVVTCDLNSEEEAQTAFKDMEIAFLAAGKVGGAKLNREDPSSLILYNLNLQSRLLYLASRMGIARCAILSSSYVYPNTGRPHVESEGFEEDPWLPMYGLGWIMRYFETLCRHFQMTTKTRYAIVRPTAYYGPYDNFNLEECHVIPALIVKAANRMDPFEVWGDGEEVRSFTYVDDLVEGLMRTVEKYAAAQPLNIGARESHNVKEAVQILLDYLEFHPRIVFNADKPSAVPYKVSDSSLAKKLIHWEAKVSLEEGLRKTMDWYLQNVHRAGKDSPAAATFR